MFRFSPRPDTQLVWLWLMRDMKLSEGKEIGVDFGCGKMINRPMFRTKTYIGIDWEQRRLATGVTRFPEVTVACGRLEDIEGLSGDFGLCIQVFQNKFFDGSITVKVLKNLVGMIHPRGTLIFNIGEKNLPYEAEIDALVKRSFEDVRKLRYGMLNEVNLLSSLYSLPLAGLMYLWPALRVWRRRDKIYYVCDRRIEV